MGNIVLKISENPKVKNLQVQKTRGWDAKKLINFPSLFRKNNLGPTQFLSEPYLPSSQAKATLSSKTNSIYLKKCQKLLKDSKKKRKNKKFWILRSSSINRNLAMKKCRLLTLSLPSAILGIKTMIATLKKKKKMWKQRTKRIPQKLL